MRILITGSRNWRNEGLIEQVLGSYDLSMGQSEQPVLVHGDCPTGADAIADRVARELGWTVEKHPADWRKYGKAAGPIRNQKMVKLDIDLCIAFVNLGSYGTRDCIRRARSAGIHVNEFWEDEL